MLQALCLAFFRELVLGLILELVFWGQVWVKVETDGLYRSGELYVIFTDASLYYY